MNEMLHVCHITALEKCITADEPLLRLMKITASSCNNFAKHIVKGEIVLQTVMLKSGMAGMRGKSKEQWKKRALLHHLSSWMLELP